MGNKNMKQTKSETYHVINMLFMKHKTIRIYHFDDVLTLKQNLMCHDNEQDSLKTSPLSEYMYINNKGHKNPTVFTLSCSSMYY